MKRNFSDEERARLVTTRDDAKDGLLRAETSHGYAKEWHQQVTDRYAEQITEQDRDRVRPELAESADKLRSAQDTLRDATKQYDDAENTLSSFDRDRRSQTVDDYLVTGGKESAKGAGKAWLEQQVGQLPELPPDITNQMKYQADRIYNEQIKPWAEENLKVSSAEELDRLAQETKGSLDTPQNQVLRDIEREVPTSGELEAPAFPKPSDTVPASPGEPEPSKGSQSKFAQMPSPQDDVPQPAQQGSATSKDAPAVPQPDEAVVKPSSQPSSSQSVSKFTNVPPPNETVAPASSSPAPEGPSASKFTHVPEM